MPADVAPPSICTSSQGLGVFLVSSSFGQGKIEEYGNDTGCSTHLKALDLGLYMPNPHHSLHVHRCHFQQKHRSGKCIFP